MNWTSYFVLFWISLAAAAPDPLLVDLPNGKVRGRDNGGYYSYESIPYAVPPVGDLRFEAPQQYTNKWTETFDGTKPPVFCVQLNQLTQDSDQLMGQEDCLTVSVYKPKNMIRKYLPVVIEIHGGAFTFTVSSNHSHEHFMANGNVILVKFNYRVGPLGFASTEDNVITGNFGLKDQRLALRWIKQNIHRFGGNPDQMIAVGLAAGGAALHLQMLHNKDEFQSIVKGGISISGNALLPWVMQKGIRYRSFELGHIVGCGVASNSQELKKCLQGKEATEIVRGMRQLMVLDFVPFTPFSPVVEPSDSPDAFLTQHPIEIIKSGKFSQVPWAVSYTSENGIYNAAQFRRKQCGDGPELIEELNNRWFDLAPELFFYRYSMKTVKDMDDYSRDIRQHYMANKKFSTANYKDMEIMFTDILFKNGTDLAVELHRTYGKSEVYGFVYDNPSDGLVGEVLSKRKDIRFGTGITDDYFLLFENPLRPCLRKDEEIISHKLVKMLADFVASDNSSLIYDTCEFPSSNPKKPFQTLSIKRDCCGVSAKY